ncbi:MAG: GTP-binding protein [Candidatus Tectomicrobia bacterium]|nr:GTP-binding protein [Candidatus Tectomicrobia bacterium]
MTTRIPLTVITGFLGSGKTTIVREFLRRKGYQKTAVIINEFGAIGIDHDLIESSREELISLSTGCLCCAMQGDLAQTVRRLMAAAVFDRILLETSGMADPAPILQTAIVDPYLSETVEIANVVVTVDALNGPAVIHDHDEARRQVALGDRVLITKSDLDTHAGAVAANAVRAYRPDVALAKSINGDVEPELLFAPADHRTPWHSVVSEPDDDSHTHAHDAAIASVSLRVDAPIHAVALTLFLQALAENCGPDLLRVKGIVSIRESPESPAVVHGVQHVFHPIEWLDQWPSEDRSSRFVLIGRRLDATWLKLMLWTIEEEVEQATRP